jgi:small subunit ribosomal protein S17
MAEEEKNETTEETQAEETPAEEAPAEGADAPAAGPVAEDVPPADSPEEASSTPPAEDVSEEEAPAEEVEPEPPAAEQGEAEEEAPAAEAEPEADPDADLPWKERRRLERSRRSHEPRAQQTVEERAAARIEARKAKAAARSRYRRNRRGKKGEPGTGTPPAEREGNPAKVRQGVVVSDKADKTITVRIDITRRHPTYEKVVRRSRTLHAHDERNEAGAGDVVRVVESRPLSKQKRWRLLEVLEKAR